MPSFGFTDRDLLISPEALVRKLGQHMDALWVSQPDARNPVWTTEVKRYLAQIAQEIVEERDDISIEILYTNRTPKIVEFLWDVVWWCRRETDKKEEFMALAVECEWGSGWRLEACVGEDFSKLTVAKCPLKLMIFCTELNRTTGTHESQQTIVLNEIDRHLKFYSHHMPGERYIFLDTATDGNRRSWIRTVDENGVLSELSDLLVI